AIELVALRGGTGRPDVATLRELFDRRYDALLREPRKPFWLGRLARHEVAEARKVLAALGDALAPLARLRETGPAELSDLGRASVKALEALAREPDGALAELYRGEAGEALARFLREVVESRSGTNVVLTEWPDVLAAMIAGEVVKPAQGADHRVAIWGTLEARLQSVDTLVLGGLNEGVWPESPP